jgi:hypothetical protein
MGILDRARDRVTGLLEENLGYTILDADEASTLRESYSAYADLRADANDLAFHALQYWTGRPQELRPERRARLAQKARVAWMEDPVAGTEAEHYANFALGRGVNKPRAKNAAVQKVIDRGWDDPINKQKLTSLDALRAISNELKTGANVYAVAYTGNGRVRIGFLEADSVTDIVTHDDDRQLPLYYCARTYERRWDFATDQELFQPSQNPVVTYFPHWCNPDILKAEAKRNGTRAPQEPPKEKLGPGRVYHLRINRLMEAQFGTPPWARQLRFFSALNRLMEARVAMAQAASSIIAKRVVKGTPNDVMKAAQSVLQQTGEIGAARGQAVQAMTGMRPPLRPASIMAENESHRLESVNLNSGASQAEGDTRMIRGSATAPSAMGQHYFGAGDSANLSTAVTQELPALMATGAYQEVFEQLLRWFTDLLIEEAVRAGELGGAVRAEDDGGPALSELRLSEAADREIAKKRTRKDLSYSFEMPYPGRRNLPEVTSAFSTIMSQLSPIGENEVLTEAMLQFVFTHGLQLEEASELATAVSNRQQELLKSQQEKQQEQQQQAETTPDDGSGTMPADTPPDTQQSQYGEPRRTAQPSGDMSTVESAIPDDVEAAVDLLLADFERTIELGVVGPAVTVASRVDS